MAIPGTVMGEEELQALADVRGACVQVSYSGAMLRRMSLDGLACVKVRSVVCAVKSSDFGSALKPVTYFPRPMASGIPFIGRGDTLVLLQVRCACPVLQVLPLQCDFAGGARASHVPLPAPPRDAHIAAA